MTLLVDHNSSYKKYFPLKISIIACWDLYDWVLLNVGEDSKLSLTLITDSKQLLDQVSKRKRRNKHNVFAHHLKDHSGVMRKEHSSNLEVILI